MRRMFGAALNRSDAMCYGCLILTALQRYSSSKSVGTMQAIVSSSRRMPKSSDPDPARGRLLVTGEPLDSGFRRRDSVSLNPVSFQP